MVAYLSFGTARGRVNAARLLLDLLPPELTAISTPEDRAAEYLDYRQFFIAWETLERVKECQALEAPQMSRDTRGTWLRDYGVCIPTPFPPLSSVLIAMGTGPGV
jgi:nuclear pore complex protein Nup107